VVAGGQSIPLTNGGFEDNGPAANPFSFFDQIQQRGWERAGAMVIGTFRAHCGIRSLSTGGSWGGNGFAYTQITIPANAPNPMLYLWLDVESRVAATSGVVDTLKVIVDGGTGDFSPNPDFSFPRTPPAPLATFSNLDSVPGQGFVRKAIRLPATLNGSPIQGQSIQLWLISSINSWTSTQPMTTDFYIDDVTLWTDVPLLTPTCAA
jgi:hypothetical protein